MHILRKAKDIENGVRGLKLVWREERHFSLQLGLVAAGVVFSALIAAPAFDVVLLIAFGTLILAAEVANTAFEDLCNKIEPSFDPKIGAIKDMAQAFVVLSAIPYCVLFAWIVLTYLP